MNSRSWIAAALTLAACGGTAETAVDETLATLPASVPSPDVEDGVLIVTPEQVNVWMESGHDFVLVDTRDPVQFEREHIPGAINISYVVIRPGAQLPPRKARIVVYCSDSDCPISQYAYRSFQSLGYTEVYDMRAGIQGWKSAGYTTEIGQIDEE